MSNSSTHNVKMLGMKNTFSLRKIDIGLIALILVPILLALSNQEWLFPYGNATDTWLNTVFFNQYGVPNLFHSYKAARVDWIFKGYFFHKYFSDIHAYLIMCFLTYYMCTIPFYYIAKQLFKKEIAIIIALAYATYSQFISIISFEWDYTTHDGIANLNLALLFLVLAAKKNHYKIYLFLAGLFITASFQNIYTIITFPAILVFFWMLNKKEKQLPIKMCLLYFILGIIISNIIFCAINYFVFGGPFLYFADELSFSLYFLHSQYQYRPSYWMPLGTLLLEKKNVILPFIFTALSAIALTLGKISKKYKDTRNEVNAALYPGLITFMTMFIFELFGHPLLSYEHMTIGGVTFFFLSFGAASSLIWEQEFSGNTTQKTYWNTTVLSLIAVCGALILGHYSEKIAPMIVNILIFIALLNFILKKDYSTRVKIWVITPITLIILLSQLMHFHETRIFWNKFGINPKIACLAILYSSLAAVALYRHKVFVATISLFIFINIYTTSIPLELFQFNFDSTFHKDGYTVVTAASKFIITPPFNSTYLLSQYDFSNYHTTKHSNKKIAQIYWGSTKVPLVQWYRAISATYYQPTYYQLADQRLKKRRGLTIDSFKNQCPALYKKAPKWINKKSDALAQQGVILGGYMRTIKFSQASHLDFWLNIMPKDFTLTILTKNKFGFLDAIKSIHKYGYKFNISRFKKIKTPSMTMLIYQGHVLPNENIKLARTCLDEFLEKKSNKKK